MYPPHVQKDPVRLGWLKMLKLKYFPNNLLKHPMTLIPDKFCIGQGLNSRGSALSKAIFEILAIFGLDFEAIYGCTDIGNPSSVLVGYHRHGKTSNDLDPVQV